MSFFSFLPCDWVVGSVLLEERKDIQERKRKEEEVLLIRWLE
jgi:hypothetical protein